MNPNNLLVNTCTFLVGKDRAPGSTNTSKRNIGQVLKPFYDIIARIMRLTTSVTENVSAYHSPNSNNLIQEIIEINSNTKIRYDNLW